MSDNANEMCDKVDSQNSGHWVEELFPPRFSILLQQLVDGCNELTGDSTTLEHNGELYAQLARGISPLDIAAVKNVYQRVWLMMKTNESASDGEKEQSWKLEDMEVQSLLQSGSKVGCKPDKRTDSHTNNSCIWHSSEIHVLRQAFKATGDENTRLRSQVCVLQDNVEKMTAERCVQRKVQESTQQRLHQAETANKRLQMLVNHLKLELNQTTQELDRLRMVEAEQSVLSSRLQNMQLEFSTADCRHDGDVAATEAKWLKVLEEQRLGDAAGKTQLNRDVSKLVDRVAELEQQLSKEKADHCRTRKGLEHLQVHFQGLPTSGEQLNHVHKDELVTWTY